MPERAQVRVRVCVGVIARMVKAIRRCRRNAGNAGNGGALCDHLNVAACQKVLKDGGGADRGLHDPLPGVLDHTEFSRVTTDLRRCTLCGEGRAVFVSEDRRMRWCRAGRFPPTRR